MFAVHACADGCGVEIRHRAKTESVLEKSTARRAAKTDGVLGSRAGSHTQGHQATGPLFDSAPLWSMAMRAVSRPYPALPL